MKLLIYIALTILGLSFGNFAVAESGHDHSGHDHSGHDNEKKNVKLKKKNEIHKHEDHKGHKEGEKNHDDDGRDENKHNDEEAGHSEHSKNETSKFGEGKAILEVKGKGKQFKLAKSAIKTMEIGSVELNSPSSKVFEVPASSVVDFQDEIGIYKRNGDWFELVKVKLVQRGKYAAKIKTNELSAGDEIVNAGVALLRVAHLEASGQGGKGHAH